MTGIPLALRQRRPVLLLVAFLCLLMLGLAPKASAAGSGFFSPTGSMSVSRSGALAAPLPDGRVLVAGCCGFYDPLSSASAEVFDPATNTFSSAGIGSMSVPRYEAVAAPLPDGRVLVAGGFYYYAGSPQYHSSAEVFDPATNTFSSAGIGSMSVPRMDAVAAPLPDGRVLVAGGDYSEPGATIPNQYLSSAEVFDPATNTFSSAGVGSMSVGRSGAVAAPLPDGRVLVAGGQGPFDPATADLPPPSATAEVFNPATNTFSSAGIGSISVGRIGAAAAPLPDGALVVGGSGGAYTDYPVSSAEVFDPATNTFSSAGIGSMSVGRYKAVAAPLPDGRVLVAGGLDSPQLSSAEIFAGCAGCVGSAPPAPAATCKGKQATIVGTHGSDVRKGTPGNDVIAGLGGNDKLSGLAGNDLICGGKGADLLKGGSGNDFLSGQKGNDKLLGQEGNDKLSGKAGKDTLKGGPGKDKLKGGGGKDKQVQ